MFQGRLAWVAATLLTVTLLTANAAPRDSESGKPSVIGADMLTSDAVAGISTGEWTARWWRWALTQSIAPYLDPDGRFCDLGQEGPVWFLAGTNGHFRPQRTCEIPKDKYLLVPVINMVYWQAAPGSALPCKELQAHAAVNNEHLRSAVAMLDDKPLGDIRLLRVRSDGCFPMDPQAERPLLGAADGYWLMIKPLAPGRHTLVIGANYGDDSDEAYGGMNQNFEYVLDVGGKTTLSQLGGSGHRWAP